MSKKISEHFYESEVRCSCGCGQMVINYELLYMLEVARTRTGVLFSITSWFRCEDYNSRVSQVEKSAHTKGLAVDIWFKNEFLKYFMLCNLSWAGFKRIGISDKGNFIHVDIDRNKPWPAIWTY